MNHYYKSFETAFAVFSKRREKEQGSAIAFAQKLKITTFLLFLFSSMSWGQTTLISSTGDGGFENGSTFTANGWTAANTGGNRLWQIGTGQSGYTGSRAAFIGNDATTVGTTTSSRPAVHLYRSVTIPSGATNIVLTFKYKQSAVDNTFDYLKVFYNSNTPIYGTAQTTGLLTTVDPTSSSTYASFTTVSTTIPNSNAGSTKNLIFTFTADGVAPNAYGAIDDIQITYDAAAPCSGTPVPGNTVASVNPVGSGSSTVLSLQNATTGSGVTYQWKSSTDNVTYTSISGATNATYTATPSAATYYVCDVTCSGVTTTSNPLQVTLMYCTPIATSATVYISSFSTTSALTNISNTTSAQSSAGYGNFTGQSVSNFATGNINYSSIINGVSGGVCYAIFVDWNNDFDFADTGEKVIALGESSQITTNPSGSFIVPAGTPLGNYRMRVVLSYATGTVSSCYTTLNGEVEDYTLTVVAQPTCMVPTALTSSAISYQTATIGWTAPATGTSPASYEYEVRTSGAAGSGATGLVTSGTTTAPTASVSLTGLNGGTTYTYYVRSDCGGGDFSSWSNATFTTTSCNVPTAVTSSAITTTTATVSWTAPATGSPAGYEYEIRTSGAAGSGTTGLISTGTTTSPTVSANLTGLSASTTYSVYVRTNCYSGFSSSWTNVVTFNTLCDAVTSFPASEAFDTYLPTACWQEGDLGELTAGPTTIGGSNTSDWIEDGFLNSGTTGAAKMNIDAASGSEWLLSPFYTIPATGYRVKYSVGATNWNVTTVVTNWEADDFVELLVSTSNTNWTVLKTYNTSNVPSHLGQVDNVDLSAYSGQTIRFAFRAFEGTSNGSADIDFFIDNFTIEQTPNTWTGATSSSWNTASNWSLNTVPTSTHNIVISSNGTNAPVMDADVAVPSGKSLTISGTGTLTVAPGKTLTIAGTADFGGKAVTFKSDATGSGMFGPLTGTLTGATNVIVERYIPARRAFRFISAPVTTTTTIKQNWQENAGSTAGLGTHITGTGGATNGFDTTETNNPSLFTFTSGAWAAVTNTNVNVLTAGTPYRLMVRGDRTTDLTSNAPTATATTLRATGTLKTGSFSPTINQTADGYSLIGNPYQAPIDIKAILTAASNMNAGVAYYWDPTLNTRGGYVTRDLTTDVNDVTSGFNQYVQPGQAVFVKRDNTANAASVTITESHKSVANGAAGVFRTTTPNDFGLLRVNLQANTNNQWQNIEGTLALFNDNFSWNVTPEDATKMSNLDEEVSFVQNNTSLAIACLSAPSTTAELPIQMNNLRQSNYQWQFELANYQGERPYLYDAQNNSYTEITNGVVVPFTATTATANRFKIVFQPSALSTDDFANGLVVYPNPAKAGASFFVQGITAAQVTVYNVLGQNIPVQVKSQGNALQVTPTQTLSQGIYLVTVTTEGKTQQVKWIVE